jgi:hypothetical protein
MGRSFEHHQSDDDVESASQRTLCFPVNVSAKSSAQSVRVGAILKCEAAGDRRIARGNIRRRSVLRGFDEHFSERIVSGELGKRARVRLPAALEIKVLGEPAIVNTSASGHRDTSRRASEARMADAIAVSGCANESEGLFSNSSRPPSCSIFEAGFRVSRAVAGFGVSGKDTIHATFDLAA